jgi:DNA-binding NtrC family response regulator
MIARGRPGADMRKFLIVDDNREIADNLAEIVSDAGIGEATVAESGDEALALARTTHFDALVTDMRMPAMSGLELIRNLRAIDPTLPAIVVTAYAADADVANLVREGVLSIFPKPVPIATLLQLLERAQRGGLIALVDDDRALSENLADVLRGHGFGTVVAHSVAESEQLDGPFCLALVDLRLPGAPDGEAARRLAARFPRLPLLVMTAFADPATALPRARVVEKPFEMARLMALVAELRLGVAEIQANAAGMTLPKVI